MYRRRKSLIHVGRCLVFPTLQRGKKAPCTFYWTCSFTSSVIFCVTTLTLILWFHLVVPDLYIYPNCVCVYLLRRMPTINMHNPSSNLTLPFLKKKIKLSKHGYPVSTIYFILTISRWVLSSSSHVLWRVQLKSWWEMMVAIKLYLCSVKTVHLSVWLMLVWPPSLPEHLVINIPPPVGLV